MAGFGCGAWAQESKIDEPAAPAQHVPRTIGPGWYDSSWDLLRGLIVREGMPTDAKLDEWLGNELIGATGALDLCEAFASPE